MKTRLRVAQAADLAEIDRLTYGEWGSRLSLGQYLERERVLRDQAWTRAGWTPWLLEDESGRRLSSCETYAMRSEYLPRKGTSAAYAPGGESDLFHAGELPAVEEYTTRSHARVGPTLAIASVFTAPADRRQGYANLLLQALAEEIARPPQGAPTAHAMVLYSEVGATLYEKTGFIARPSFERRWTVATVMRDRANLVDRVTPGALDSPHSARLVTNADAAAALLDRGRTSGGAAFHIVPSPALLAWHLARAQFYAQALGLRSPPTLGAATEHAHLLWMIDAKANCLRILHAHAAPAPERDGEERCGAELARLFALAADTARQCGLPEIRAWEEEDLDAKLWSALPAPAERAERKDSLAMIRLLQPELNPADWGVISRLFWV